MNPMTTPEDMENVLDAIHDEALKLIDFLNGADIPDGLRERLKAKASLIESLARHQVDIRTEHDKNAL